MLQEQEIDKNIVEKGECNCGRGVFNWMSMEYVECVGKGIWREGEERGEER